MNLELFKDLIGNWKTKKNIIKELEIDPARERDLWRKAVENFNREYEAHLTNGYFIAHSNKGYKLTNENDDMRKSDQEMYKKCMNMLGKISRHKKARQEDMHLFQLELVQDIKKLDITSTEQLQKITK